MSINRACAKRLLKHYLRYGVQANGLVWDLDNDAEVDDIVDYLIDAAKDELAAEIFESSEQYPSPPSGAPAGPRRPQS